MTRKATLRTGIVAAAMTLAMVLSAAPAFAAGPGGGGGGGKGGGQGGGGGETTVPNNLSVPAIFIPNTTALGAPALNITTCSATATDPTGTPLTNYPIDSAAYYYVQGIHTWQSSCYTSATATAYVAWGDNLTGDAKLKTNSPIRVEVGLLQGSPDANGVVIPTTVGTGYTVDKLDPNALDRDSAYGTLAKQTDSVWGPAARNDTFPETRVWVSGATLKIYNISTPNSPVFSGAATAEINATGRIVYGYNLRVSTAGTYVIEFTVPASTVTYSGSDAGTVSGLTASTEITVVGNASGGAKGGNGRNG